MGERFSRYQIKVVGQRATGDTGRDNPFINFLGVAPTRSAASFTIDGGGGGTPTSGIARGMVLPFLGKDTDPILQGSDGVAAQFLLCDGTYVSNTTYIDLKTTLVAAGVNPSEKEGQFQIPDLGGRTLVGTGNLLGTEQAVGTAIGSDEVDLTGASFTATMNTTTATGGGSGTPAIVTKSVGSVTENDTLITVSGNDADNTNSKNVQPSFVVRYIIKT